METILQDDLKICPVCQKQISGVGEWHHIYNGTANRKKSEEDGMKIYIHKGCHRFLTDHKRTEMNLKARYQPRWCEYYGKTTEDFIKRYGQDYIVRFRELMKGGTNDTKKSNIEPFAEE